jgi:hypothetical protein
MQEKALVYFVVAYLAGWLIDLVVIVARGPALQIDPVLKLLVVLVCLIIILVGLARHNWLLGT